MLNFQVSPEDEKPCLPESTYLGSMRAGHSAIVIRVEESPQQARLMELGFVPGQFLDVLRGGDPMIIGMGGSKIAIGKSLLDTVSVIPE